MLATRIKMASFQALVSGCHCICTPAIARARGNIGQSFSVSFLSSQFWDSLPLTRTHATYPFVRVASPSPPVLFYAFRASPSVSFCVCSHSHLSICVYSAGINRKESCVTVPSFSAAVCSDTEGIVHLKRTALSKRPAR